jgi:FAM91 N-terminus
VQQRSQVEYSRKSLMLFPYHLSDVIVRVLNVTPFLYYVGMLEYLVKML